MYQIQLVHMWHDSFTYDMTRPVIDESCNQWIRFNASNSMYQISCIWLIPLSLGTNLTSHSCHTWIQYDKSFLSYIGLFCKRALWKRRYSAKETYNFHDLTARNRQVIPVIHMTSHSCHTYIHVSNSYPKTKVSRMCDMTHEMRWCVTCRIYPRIYTWLKHIPVTHEIIYKQIT